MTNFRADRPGYQWAPRHASQRRDAWEGIVLAVLGLLLALLALEVLVL
jgi:hypothetical protein